MQRREDERFLTGKGRYTADWNLPGQLHACVLRAQFADIIGLPREKIRVATQDVGGSFGVRSFAYAEHMAVMLAAKRLGRPHRDPYAGSNL